MNVNTIAGFLNGSGRNQFPSQALAAVTETAFTIGTDSGTPTTAFIVPPQQAAILGGVSPLSPNVNQALLNAPATQSQFNILPDPPFNTGTFDGRLIRVRLSGAGNAGANAAQSVTVRLYQGTSATLGSDTLLGATTALATVAGGAFSFFMEALLFWESTTQIMSGYFQYQANFANKAGSITANYAQITNYPVVTSPAGLSFLGSIQFGNAAASTVQLKEFAAEQV